MIQYGYVEISVPAGDASPEMLAAQYVSYVHAFQKEEQATVDRLAAAPKEAAPGDPRAAAGRLADGRSPRTVDEANEMARQVIEKELGSVTEVSEEGEYDSAAEAREATQARTAGAPWANKVQPKKKPWEQESQPAPTTGVGW
jgi:hypothetical protein